MSTQLDQIKSTLERFAAAWKTNDGAAVGGYFVDDGSLINPFGERAQGRATVSAMYTQYFGGMLRDTATTFQLANVRPVAIDYAFVDAQQTISAKDGSPVLVVHLAALMHREGDGWRFVDARPFTVASPN